MARHRDDDDDESDEPRQRRTSKQRGKKNNTPLIIAAVAVVAVVLIASCAGIAWWAISTTTKAIQEISGQEDSSEEAENFLGKLSSEQTQAAYDSATPAFQQSMTREQFQLLLQKHSLLTRHTDARPLTFDNPTGIAPNRRRMTTFELTESDDDNDPGAPRPKLKPRPAGPKSLTVTIIVAEQPGGYWKVDGMTVK